MNDEVLTSNNHFIFLFPCRSSSWKEVKQFLMENVEKSSATNLGKNLQDLWARVKELTGDDVTLELIDNSAIFVLRLLMDQKLVMLKHLSEMRKIFGNVTSNQANKIFSVSILITI